MENASELSALYRIVDGCVMMIWKHCMKNVLHDGLLKCQLDPQTRSPNRRAPSFRPGQCIETALCPHTEIRLDVHQFTLPLAICVHLAHCPQTEILLDVHRAMLSIPVLAVQAV